MSISNRSAEDNSYPGIVGLKVETKLLEKQLEQPANILLSLMLHGVQLADQLFADYYGRTYRKVTFFLTSESNTRVIITRQLDEHRICFFYVPDQSPSQVP